MNIICILCCIRFPASKKTVISEKVESSKKSLQTSTVRLNAHEETLSPAQAYVEPVSQFTCAVLAPYVQRDLNLLKAGCAGTIFQDLC